MDIHADLATIGAGPSQEFGCVQRDTRVAQFAEMFERLSVSELSWLNHHKETLKNIYGLIKPFRLNEKVIWINLLF